MARNKIVITFFLIIAGFFFVLMLDHLVATLQQEITEQESEERQKKINSMTNADEIMELSQEILYENETFIIYSDRIINKFQYEKKSIENVRWILNGIQEEYSQLKNIYLMPIPTRGMLENPTGQCEKNYGEYINLLEGNLSSKTILVDTLEELKKHSDEYVYFRTEDSWTGRGAYYGAKVFFESMGISLADLGTFEEYRYNSFSGSLKRQALNQLSDDERVTSIIKNISSDSVYYYICEQNANRERIKHSESGEWISQRMISEARMGTSTFVGSSWSEAIVEGNPKAENATLLVICDGRGKILTPFLTEHYKKIYLINLYEDVLSFTQILEEYQITDLLWAQTAQNVGEEAYSKLLNKYIKDQED